MKSVIVLIDGGFLRINARRAQKLYDPTFIEQFALSCKTADEEILRVLYYDCAPFIGNVRLPVTGQMQIMSGSDEWLHDLAARDLFAVRRGVLKFRGFKPRKTPVNPSGPLTDADFEPDFEQKGVDMRIGLDIAAYSANKSVNRIVLVSNDTDCVPAMKYGRKAGLQVVIVRIPNCNPSKELVAHADFKRAVPWP